VLWLVYHTGLRLSDSAQCLEKQMPGLLTCSVALLVMSVHVQCLPPHAGLRLSDPVSQLLLQATVLPQTQRYGDGGLLALHIACT
jgi:hypothetical protein